MSPGSNWEHKATIKRARSTAALRAYARCVRANGLADFPDPQVGSDGVPHFPDSAPRVPVAAQRACQAVARRIPADYTATTIAMSITFTNSGTVLPLAASCLRIVSCGNIGYAYGMVMLQAFNGAGDTVTPTIVNFFGFWVLEIPLAYWLAIRMQMQSKGAFWAIVVAEGAIAGASAILFRQGRWKRQKI